MFKSGNSSNSSGNGKGDGDAPRKRLHKAEEDDGIGGTPEERKRVAPVQAVEDDEEEVMRVLPQDPEPRAVFASRYGYDVEMRLFFLRF